MGQVIYSPNYKAFVTLVSDADKQALPVQSEEYADLTGKYSTVADCLSVCLSNCLSSCVALFYVSSTWYSDLTSRYFNTIK